jgi:hypothetical protein
MSKRGARMALGDHETEPPLKRQDAEDQTLSLHDDVLSLILWEVVSECQPGLAQPVRLVCRRWNAILKKLRARWVSPAVLSDPGELSASLGEVSLVEYYWPVGAPGYHVMIAAARHGHLDVMRLAKRRGVPPEWAMTWAAREGQLAAMHLLRKWGCDELDAALGRAAVCGQVEAIYLLAEWGASAFYMASIDARRGGHTEVAELLLKLEFKEGRIRRSRAVFGRFFGV